MVDTNVVVSGLITADAQGPTARVLDGMLHRTFDFLLSVDLLTEYRSVLLRPKIAALHGLSEKEIDSLLTDLAANAIVRENEKTVEKAPDQGDQHLWSLLATQAGSSLITGDQALLKAPPKGRSTVSPRTFVDRLDKAT